MFEVGGEACVTCPPRGVALAVAAAGLLLLLAFVWNVDLETVEGSSAATRQPARRQSDIFDVSSRIAISLMVTLGSVGDFRARGPHPLRSMLGSAQGVSSSLNLDMLAVKCGLGLGFYARLWSSAMLPLLLSLLTVLCVLRCATALGGGSRLAPVRAAALWQPAW